LLELDALPSAFRANAALDANRHAGFEASVVSRTVPVHLMSDPRIVVYYADAMREAAIAVLDVLVRYRPCTLRELPERHAGT
jgi:hypothetical protein